jgi:hypothetical protein
MMYSDWRRCSWADKLENLVAVAERLETQIRRAGADDGLVPDMRYWTAEAARLVAWPHVDGQYSLPDDVVYYAAMNSVHAVARSLGF